MLRRRIFTGVAVTASAGAAVLVGLAIASGEKREAAAQSGGSSDPITEAYAQMDEARRRNPGWWRHRRPLPKRPKWATVAKPPEGLLDVTKPFPSQFYLLEAKGWQDWHAGWLTITYAGAFTQDRAQGIVIVESSPYPLRIAVDSSVNADAPDRTRSTLYRTPIQTGSVRIVSVTGDVLRLVSKQGRRMTFDLSDRKFRVL